MPKRDRELQSAEKAIASGAWSLPAWLRLKRDVEHERTQCWLMVALAALAFWPLGWGVAHTLLSPLALFSGADPFAPFFGSGAPSSAAPFMAFQGVQGLLAMGLSALAPVAVLLLALSNYRRQYQLTVRDLVYGNVALMLIDEGYGQIVEQAAQERYRPNPNRVDFGFDLSGRLNHFAHYYKAYYRLSWGPADVQVPFTIERNCWWEGPLLCAGGCPPFCCLTWPLLLALGFRVIFVWPKLLAIKQAVLEYLGGRFDSAWEGNREQGTGDRGQGTSG
jgi:hypothetical protein